MRRETTTRRNVTNQPVAAELTLRLSSVFRLSVVLTCVDCQSWRINAIINVYYATFIIMAGTSRRGDGITETAGVGKTSVT